MLRCCVTITNLIFFKNNVPYFFLLSCITMLSIEFVYKLKKKTLNFFFKLLKAINSKL